VGEIGVSLRTVYNIKNNKTWKHLQEVGSITPQKLPMTKLVMVEESKLELQGGKTGVNEDMIKEIQRRLIDGHNMNIIAKECGVPFYVVHDIKYGRLY